MNIKAEMVTMDNLRSINGPQKYYNTSIIHPQVPVCHGSGEYTMDLQFEPCPSKLGSAHKNIYPLKRLQKQEKCNGAENCHNTTNMDSESAGCSRRSVVKLK